MSAEDRRLSLLQAPEYSVLDDMFSLPSIVTSVNDNPLDNSAPSEDILINLAHEYLNMDALAPDLSASLDIQPFSPTDSESSASCIEAAIAALPSYTVTGILNMPMLFPVPMPIPMNQCDFPASKDSLPQSGFLRKSKRVARGDQLTLHARNRFFIEAMEHYIKALLEEFSLRGITPIAWERVDNYGGISSLSLSTMFAALNGEESRIQVNMARQQELAAALALFGTPERPIVIQDDEDADVAAPELDALSPSLTLVAERR
uniref:Uncharacterized protein n=1 Tax=Mycena chlorophos TaxID=658473 RepID=A0ABQ0LV24_MYCCL|nr:predicted protein [Mycena chlorophos]